jgi:hypothetical protein
MIKKIDAANRKIKENITLMKRVWNWSLNHFFITFITLYIISTLFLIFNYGAGSLVSGTILFIYFIAFLANRVTSNINRLLHHELGLKEIVVGYITSVLFLILLFAILYWMVTVAGAGYLRYGECVDTGVVNSAVIRTDPNLVTKISHYPYFSAITFFTVGSGDICPMGWNKLIAVINALIGNAFTVLILAIAITNYSAKKENGRK